MVSAQERGPRVDGPQSQCQTELFYEKINNDRKEIALKHTFYYIYLQSDNR